MVKKQTIPAMRGLTVGLVQFGPNGSRACSVQEAAHRANVHRTTVSRWDREFQTGQKLSRKRGSGLKTKVTEEENHNLVSYLKDNPFHSLKRAIREVNYSGSTKTAARILKREGLNRRRAAKKRFLTEAHRQARLQWCNARRHMHPQDWHDYIFSDEKTFSSKGDGPVYCWRPDGERYNDKYIAPKFDSGWFSIHAWCAISADGTLEFHTTPTSMKDVDYIWVLEDRMLPAGQQRFPFMQLIYQQVRNKY